MFPLWVLLSSSVSCLPSLPSSFASSSSSSSSCEWSPWSSPSECSADCGSCGRLEYIRVCKGGDECNCSGNSSRIEVCNIRPCPTPAPAPVCCDGYSKEVVGGEPLCLPKDQDSLPICIGEWSPWKRVNEGCSATCGMCGTRVLQRRECLPDGCFCQGESSKEEKCESHLCPYPMRSCCDGYRKGLGSNGHLCVALPFTLEEQRKAQVGKLRGPDIVEIIRQKMKQSQEATTIPPQIIREGDPLATCQGKWGPWFDVEDAPCSDTCGMCGVVEVQRRECTPEGCLCHGSSSRFEDCAPSVCPLGRQPCCAGYRLLEVGNTRQCIAGDSKKNSKKTDRKRGGIAKEEGQPPTVCRGVWSRWFPIANSSCSDDCGWCGKRTAARRTCLPAQCKCTGDTELYAPCNGIPCVFPRPRCCPPSVLTASEQIFTCALNSKEETEEGDADEEKKKEDGEHKEEEKTEKEEDKKGCEEEDKNDVDKKNEENNNKQVKIQTKVEEITEKEDKENEIQENGNNEDKKNEEDKHEHEGIPDDDDLSHNGNNTSSGSTKNCDE